jgi:hypothetical protein
MIAENSGSLGESEQGRMAGRGINKGWEVIFR